jgi:hypothetical protein
MALFLAGVGVGVVIGLVGKYGIDKIIGYIQRA